MLFSVISALLDRPRRKASRQVRMALANDGAANPLTTTQAARLFALALKLSGLTAKEAMYAMGYEPDSSVTSRWASGLEPVQFARVIAVPQLRRGLLLALAESGDTGVRVDTIVTVQVPA